MKESIVSSALRQTIRRLRGFLRVGILSLLVTIGLFQPTPAHAQWVVIDPTEIADDLAQWAKEAIQWITQNSILSGGFNEVTNAVQILFEGNTSVSQGNTNSRNDNERLAHNTAVTSKISADAAQPANGKACTEAVTGQNRQGLGDAVASAIYSSVSWIRSIGTGPKADNSSPAAAAANICSRMGNSFSFIDPSIYGSLISQIKCPNASYTPPTPNPYANMDESIASVVVPMQYPIPASVTVSSDNHMNFSGAQPSSVPVEDEVRFVAAWKFCEHLQTHDGTPIYGSTLTIKALQQMDENDTHTAKGSTAASVCMRELLYRTACPSAAQSAFASVGAGDNCYQRQHDACHRLKDPLTSNGLGISKTGDAQADKALADCDTYGLSNAMFDKIMSSKDFDLTQVANKAGAISPEELEKEQHAAQDRIRSFDDMMHKRTAMLIDAIGVSVQEQMNARLEKQNDEIAEQTRLLEEQNKLLTQIISKDHPLLAGR